MAFRRAPFPGLPKRAGSSPRGISASSELSTDPVGLPRLTSALAAARLKRLASFPWGFRPLRDITAACPLFAGLSQDPLCSALRVSHPLDGFLHAAARRPCFMPQPRTGFHLQGFCSPPDDRTASRQPGPSRRFLLPSLWKPKSPCQSDKPRPQGRAPSGGASTCPGFYPWTGCAPLMVLCLFRALSPAASVTPFLERVLPCASLAIPSS